MKLAHGSKRCLCRACGEYFGAVSTFDKHRYGPWTDRVCLDRLGMAERGLAMDSLGVWRKVRVFADAAIAEVLA
jgi:hypothetical protein